MRNQIGGILTKLRVIAVAVAVAGLTAACSLGAKAAESPGEPIRSGAALNGTYRLDFDAAQQLAGGEPQPYDPFARWFAFRSTCSASGCIATGSRVKADDPGQPADPAFSVVLDWVGGEWVTTFAADETCGNKDTAVLVSWALKPGGGDTLTGTRIESSVTPGCAYNTQIPIAVKRIGDVDAAIAVADPAAQPPLKHSTPNDLSGRYSGKVTNPATGTSQTRPLEIASACVRNTDQCRMLATTTRNDGTRSVQALHFADGKWSTDLHQVAKCSDGSTGDANGHWEYVMPTRPKTPIVKVRGTEHQVSTGSCATTTDFKLLLARTGD
jgi:hypothetical protein